MRPAVGAEERLTRFLVHRNQFSSRRVKPDAFRLPANERLSVFRIDELDDPAIWQLGYSNVEQSEAMRRVRARADLVASAFLNRNLRIAAEGPDRHANVVDWPAERDRRLELARVLADDATLSLDPRPNTPIDRGDR